MGRDSMGAPGWDFSLVFMNLLFSLGCLLHCWRRCCKKSWLFEAREPCPGYVVLPRTGGGRKGLDGSCVLLLQLVLGAPRGG